MNPIKLALIGFLTWGFAAVAAVPPGFDRAGYQNLLDIATEKGEPIAVDGVIWKVLTQLTPNDEARPHHADYLGVVGKTDSAGGLEISKIQMESEIWTLDAQGDWNVEQWSWRASDKGDLSEVTHGLVVETKSGAVLNVKGLPSGQATDAAELKRWNDKLIEWYGFLKNATNLARARR